MFSTLLENIPPFSSNLKIVVFKLFFSLDKSKICRFRKGLTDSKSVHFSDCNYQYFCLSKWEKNERKEKTVRRLSFKKPTFPCSTERIQTACTDTLLYGIVDCMLFFTPFSTVFQLHHSGQCTYPCFPGILLTSTPHNILSKPLTAFPHNHCQNNGQR